MFASKFFTRQFNSLVRPGQLLLYKQDASPPSCAVIMAAHILQLPLDYKEPKLLQLEHKSPTFLKLNPMGLVPVLRDGDFILSDSHAIIKYLVERYGGDKGSILYPTKAEARAVVDQCMFFDAGHFFNVVRQVSIPTIMGNLTGPTDEHIVHIEDMYRIVEAYLTRQKYVAADHFTIADLSIGTTAFASQILHKTDHKEYPRLSEYMARLLEETCFKEINKISVEKLTKLLTKCWERNKKECE